MDQIEILIDKLLVYLPSDIPFISTLMQRPEGRYIFFGIAIVVALLLVWQLLALLQMLFPKKQSKSKADKTPPIELSERVDSDTENAAGFSFFKKSDDTETSENTAEEADLIAIEQEMLAVRQLYTDGQLIKDVYVSETRRLYNKAQSIRSS